MATMFAGEVISHLEFVRFDGNITCFGLPLVRFTTEEDRKSTRLNSSHTDIYTLSLHDALPIYGDDVCGRGHFAPRISALRREHYLLRPAARQVHHRGRSEEHTSELQSHRYLHSFPTRRSSDLWRRCLRARSFRTSN